MIITLVLIALSLILAIVIFLAYRFDKVIHESVIEACEELETEREPVITMTAILDEPLPDGIDYSIDLEQLEELIEKRGRWVSQGNRVLH